MKKFALLFIAILFAWALSAQTTFTVPELTNSQKFERATYMWFYHVNAAISYAKAEGKTVDEFATFVGDKVKQSWNKDVGFNYFVKGSLTNWITMSGSVKIIEQSDKKIVFKTGIIAPSLTEEKIKSDVSHDEILRYLEIIHTGLADYVGCSFSMKTSNDGIEITIKKK